MCVKKSTNTNLGSDKNDHQPNLTRFIQAQTLSEACSALISDGMKGTHFLSPRNAILPMLQGMLKLSTNEHAPTVLHGHSFNLKRICVAFKLESPYLQLHLVKLYVECFFPHLAKHLLSNECKEGLSLSDMRSKCPFKQYLQQLVVQSNLSDVELENISYDLLGDSTKLGRVKHCPEPLYFPSTHLHKLALSLGADLNRFLALWIRECAPEVWIILFGIDVDQANKDLIQLIDHVGSNKKVA